MTTTFVSREIARATQIIYCAPNVSVATGTVGSASMLKSSSNALASRFIFF